MRIRITVYAELRISAQPSPHRHGQSRLSYYYPSSSTLDAISASIPYHSRTRTEVLELLYMAELAKTNIALPAFHGDLRGLRLIHAIVLRHKKRRTHRSPSQIQFVGS